MVDERQFLYLGQWEEFKFYDIFKTTSQLKVITSENNLGILFSMPIYMDSKKVFHKRMIYHLFDLMSDIGGVMEALLGIVTFFTLPIAEHSFII